MSPARKKRRGAHAERPVREEWRKLATASPRSPIDGEEIVVHGEAMADGSILPLAEAPGTISCSRRGPRSHGGARERIGPPVCRSFEQRGACDQHRGWYRRGVRTRLRGRRADSHANRCLRCSVERRARSCRRPHGGRMLALNARRSSTTARRRLDRQPKASIQGGLAGIRHRESRRAGASDDAVACSYSSSPESVRLSARATLRSKQLDASIFSSGWNVQD